MTIAEMTIKYNTSVPIHNQPQITSSTDSYKAFLEIWDLDSIEMIESAYILCLSRSNKILGYKRVSIGSSSGTIFDAKHMLQYALLSNASSIIVAHNHPSGNLNPSETDIIQTRKLKEAAKLLDITLFDHIIVCTNDRYYSFADEGIL